MKTPTQPKIVEFNIKLLSTLRHHHPPPTTQEEQEQKMPPFMRNANITTIPKKGSCLLLENERGIFRVPVLRSILMRLIYNQKYESVDSNTGCFLMTE